MAGLVPTVSALFQRAFDALAPGADPVVRPSDRADLQVNGALPLAKALGRQPREIAEEVLSALDLSDVCESVEIAGPGFLNLRLSDGFLVRQLTQMAEDAKLGFSVPQRLRRAVVDYGGPNVAKEMHVGHLRSTIIGDALVRMLTKLGHEVIRENHIGDWGTPFGMLIEHLVDVGVDRGAAELAVGDLNAFYQEARKAFDADPAFAERSRRRVVALQSGDEETLRLWKILVDQSVRYFSEVFERLGVLLGPDDVVGESFYNDALAGVVEELTEDGLVSMSDGAACVFPPGFVNREGDPLPLIVRKSDGGYNYAATDLAAVRDRVQRLGADLVIYVVGLPQAQHLEMVFATAKLAGWLNSNVEAVHVGFGNVLGSDGRMFKTRSGDTVKLAELLDEAVSRAATAVAERNPSLSDSDREQVASMVGIGAVKYADLSTDRQKDYRFDWDRMLAFEGSTGPYLQYAHARIRSIFRKALAEDSSLQEDELKTKFSPGLEAEERTLAKCLLGYTTAVSTAVESWSPHKLCGYLQELAGAFTSFYERCPVMRAPDPETKASRLALCSLTGRVLADGLELLGIKAPDRM